MAFCLDLAPETPLVGFSMFDSKGGVYSKIDFDNFFKKSVFDPVNKVACPQAFIPFVFVLAPDNGRMAFAPSRGGGVGIY